jgi:predicted RNA-binding protein with TRAM domain
MPHLRLALAAGGLLLAVPALASCGFDYPTERVNTVGAGVTVHEYDVDVTGAVLVAAQPDSGTLIGSLSNNTDGAISLVSVGGDEGGVQADEFEPVEVPERGQVNLATLAEEGDGITLSGSFNAGDFVTVIFDFDNDESVSIEIPVMKPCYQFEGLDSSGEGSDAPLYSCEAAEPEAPEEH